MKKDLQSSLIRIGCISSAFILLYGAVILFQCGNDDYCSANGEFFKPASAISLDVGTGSDDEASNSNNPEDVVISGPRTRGQASLITILADKVSPPPPPLPPRRSH